MCSSCWAVVSGSAYANGRVQGFNLSSQVKLIPSCRSVADMAPYCSLVHACADHLQRVQLSITASWLLDEARWPMASSALQGSASKRQVPRLRTPPFCWLLGGGQLRCMR